ncbi:MAG: hypothetical protein JNM04_04480 [Chthonomonas sp.]|nr:hypothetical protein [Chthonomonas sp.]
MPLWQDAPGDETALVRSLINAAERTSTNNDVLSDARFDRVRSYPRFRSLIMARADWNPTTLVSRQEPGVPLQLEIAVGRPNALVYVFQPDAFGAFGEQGIHFRHRGADERHARLFAYMRSDAMGRIRIRTVMPGTNRQSGGERLIYLTVYGGPRLDSVVAVRTEPQSSPTQMNMVSCYPTWTGKLWAGIANLAVSQPRLTAQSRSTPSRQAKAYIQ